MYCNKCGKFTETEDLVCADCKAEEQQQLVHPAVAECVKVESASAKPATEIKQAKPSNGFGVASMVLGIVALIMGLIADAVADPGYAGAVAIIYLLAQPAVIVALVNGIKAIVVFVKACKNNQAKPVAGFVMGIVGLNLMATAMLYLMMAMLLAEVL